MKRVFGWICLALTLGWLCPTGTVQGRGCTAKWEYSLASLQEARRRIKSPVHRSVASRVECGADVTDALAVAEWPENCAACRLEYINLLRDLIAYARASADRSAVPKNQQAYYKLEIETRIKLGNFLVDTKDLPLINKYWSSNFEGMGDAMDRSGLGREFHQEALRNRQRVLSDKSFGTWAKAIRSCQAWDFRQGENRDFPGLRRVLLCADECRRALIRIRERAQSGQAVDKETMADILDDLLPALDQCPARGSP